MTPRVRAALARREGGPDAHHSFRGLASPHEGSVMKRDITIESLLRQSQRSKTCYSPADGAERAAFDAMVEAGSAVSPMPRLYAGAEYWGRLSEPERALHCMRSLQRLHVDWTFAGMSAALAWGLAVPEGRAWPIRVVSNHGSRGHELAALVRQRAPRVEPVLVRRLRVTSLERTVIDCMSQLDFEDALVLADSALEVGNLAREELVRLLALVEAPEGRRALDVAKHAERRVGWAARVHARVVALGYETPAELVSAWARLDGDELIKALEEAGVTTMARCPQSANQSHLASVARHASALSTPSLGQP